MRATDNIHEIYRIIQRTEDVINDTIHVYTPTGYTPTELHTGNQNFNGVCQQLRPEYNRIKTHNEIIMEAGERLERMAKKRARQADKHGIAKEYQPGELVWVKLHRRLDASRRLTKKIHLVFDGPYRVHSIIRRNAYLIENLGHVIGAFNSRQIKPHREAKLRERESEIDQQEIRLPDFIEENEDDESQSYDEMEEKIEDVEVFIITNITL